MALLERLLGEQERRKRILEGEESLEKKLIFERPEYLFRALEEGREFRLSFEKDEVVIHSFGAMETLLVDARKTEASHLVSAPIAIGFLWVEAGEAQGYLIHYPVRLWRGKDGFVHLRKREINPLMNRPLIRLAKKEGGPDLSNKRGYVDYRELKRDLQGEREKHPFELREDPAIIPSLLEEYDRWSTLSEEDEPVRRIEESEPKFFLGYRVNKDPIIPLRKIFERFENEGVVQVCCPVRKLRGILLNEFLKERMGKGETVLFGERDSVGLVRRRNEIQKMGYGSLLPIKFLGDPSYHLVNEAQRALKSPPPKLGEIASLYRDNWNRELVSFVQKQRGGNLQILKTGEDLLTGVNKFSYYHNLRTASIPLDVSRYTPLDHKKDKDFMTFFRRMIFVNRGQMRKNPLYSLRNFGSETQFQAMIAILHKAWDDVDKLQSALSEALGKEWGLGEIACLDDLVQSLEKMKFLLSYNGFPPSFFSLFEDPKAMPLAMTLSSLKERKDRLFEQICEYVSDLSRINEPLDSYLEQTKAKKFSERREGRKSLARALRDKRDLPDFITTLDSYRSVLSEYEEKTKEAEPLFGLLLYSEEGPKKALAALNFLTDYRKLAQRDPRVLRENNPFVARIFEDHPFREEERRSVKEVELCLEGVEEDFANLRDFFSNPFHEDTLPFSALKQSLKAKEGVSLAEYTQYTAFQKRLGEASPTLKEAFTVFDAVNEPLDNFENDYWYSLYKALAQERKPDASPIPAAMALCCYAPYIPEADGMAARNAWRERVIRAWSSPDGERAQQSYRYGGKIKPEAALRYYASLAKTISPLQIASPQSLSLAPVEFDCVVIEDPQALSSRDLALLLSRGRKALIVGREVDRRLTGYGEEEFSEASLLKDVYHYEDLSEDFVNLLAFGFEENRLELLTRDESNSPFPLSYKDGEGALHPVLPDCLIGAEENIPTRVVFNGLLLYLGRKPLTIVSSTMLTVDPKKAVKEALERAKVS